MTLADVDAIYRHWQRWPPLHWAIPAYMGYTKTRGADEGKIIRGKEAEKYAGNVEAMMQFFDSANGINLARH